MKGEKPYKEAMLLYENLYHYTNTLKGEKRIKKYRYFLSILRKAAYAGHPIAQFELGQQYEDINFLGIDNPYYNPQKCFYWYSKACENNNAFACNCVGSVHAKNNDVEKALLYFKMAATLGDKVAKRNYLNVVKKHNMKQPIIQSKKIVP